MDAGCRVVDQSINPTGISVQAQPRFSSRFGWRSEVSGHPAAAGGRCQIGLSRPSRNQEGKANPSAVRANSDDPPIHIRPNVPASAGAKDKNPVGSSHYGSRTMASRFFDRKGFLRRKRQQSGDKGLISCSASTAASARSALSAYSPNPGVSCVLAPLPVSRSYTGSPDDLFKIVPKLECGPPGTETGIAA